MVALRIAGGSISPEVSRELAELMHDVSLFARMEVNGWLELVRAEGLVIEKMRDVPEDLRRLLLGGWYLAPSYADDVSDVEPHSGDNADNADESTSSDGDQQ